MGGWRQNQGPCHAKGLSDFWISLLVLLPPVTLDLVASTSSPGRVLEPCVLVFLLHLLKIRRSGWRDPDG